MRLLNLFQQTKFHTNEFSCKILSKYPNLYVLNENLRHEIGKSKPKLTNQTNQSKSNKALVC